MPKAQSRRQILQAEGRREAAFRDAEARERSAEAEAKATQMVSEAIAKGDVAALNYFIADKYIKAFGQLAESPNQKIADAADRGDERARIARRHRRDREGDFWRRRGCRPGRTPRVGAEHRGDPAAGAAATVRVICDDERAGASGFLSPASAGEGAHCRYVDDIGNEKE